MKTSEALRKTKAGLWNGPCGPNFPPANAYICIAAMRQLDYKKSSEVKRLVMGLLNGCLSLGSWLRKKHGINFEDYTEGEYFAKMQATRHAWLDHLIAHYESKGD